MLTKPCAGSNASQALERVAETMPNVILLDLSLPRIPGTVIATKLRDSVPSATVVIMSAQGPALMRHLADSLRVEYFVSKSNLGSDLIASLKNILYKKSG